MQTSIAQNRHLILVTLFLALLLTLFYVYQPLDHHSSQLSEYKNSADEIESSQTPVKSKKKYTICDKVDIAWLASDRKYWDGWSDKAMFIKADGTFTQGNVYINEGEEICTVVLLGPTPAQGSIRADDHVGPKDSIVMFANGEESTKVTIQLQQDEHQPNAYYAATKFQQADKYTLDAMTEYRSYFWENPILHSYQPYVFKSKNKLIVRRQEEAKRKMPCNLKSNSSDVLTGAWVDKSQLESSHALELFTAYENADNSYSIKGKVFVPDNCQLEYKSNGQGAQCLGKKTVHALGDNNLRRNLKALKSGTNWCDIDQINQIKDKKERKEKLKCACNDDNEDAAEYPWVSDPHTPVIISNSWDVDSKIYYKNIRESIVNHEQSIDNVITEFATDETIPTADIVIIGLGSGDVEAIQATPKQFTASYIQFLTHLRKEIYPTQKIIVKTPQYFCCGTIWATSWNTGRSLAFTIVVRDAIKSLNDDNVLLWDVHSIGNEDSTCLNMAGSSYSKRNTVNLENLILWNLIC